MTKPVCVITGVGPGTGSALARRFSRGDYHVALLARSQKRIPKLQEELPNASAHICDVTQEGQVNETVAKITRDHGAPTIAIHNAVGGTFGNFLDVDPAALETNFKVNAMGLLYLARAVAPAMIKAQLTLPKMPILRTSIRSPLNQPGVRCAAGPMPVMTTTTIAERRPFIIRPATSAATARCRSI